MINSRRTSRGQYNWCQEPVPGRGPAVEKHWSKLSAEPYSTKQAFRTFSMYLYIILKIW